MNERVEDDLFAMSWSLSVAMRLQRKSRESAGRLQSLQFQIKSRTQSEDLLSESQICMYINRKRHKFKILSC